MTLFFTAFLFIYGGMHIYAFLKAKSAIGFTAKTGIAVMLLMALMVSAPFLVRTFEKANLEFPARVTANIGYLWLGFMLLFCSYAVVVDLYRILLSIANLLFNKNLPFATMSRGCAFYLPLFLSFITTVYGIVEARTVRTEKIIINTQKISKDIGHFKIALISDMHLGLIVGKSHLSRTLGIIRTERPDILLSSGDLVDGQICGLNGLSDLIREIRPKYGKFAITGNHEFYAGFEQAKCFTENAGFTLLRGEGVTIGDIINIAGVDDPVGQTLGLSKKIDENAILSKLPRDKFTLLLKHRPLVDKNAEGFFDLQLSGHVHKGQIFPFSIITKLYYPVHAGFVSLSGGSHLYVSRGTGTWGPPIRFLAPPEVTIIELINNSR